MHCVITGSSGQIGTNLALRLVAEGHDVFGVDKRLNGWTDDFRYLLQDLSGHYAAMEGGIGGVEYPEADVVVHLAAHAKVHQLVREPGRALENMNSAPPLPTRRARKKTEPRSSRKIASERTRISGEKRTSIDPERATSSPLMATRCTRPERARASPRLSPMAERSLNIPPP